MAASCTIGPSRPIEPPVEMVTREETLFTTVSRTRMMPLPRTMTSMKSRDPCARDQRWPKKRMSPATNPPAVGMPRRHGHGSVVAAPSIGPL